MKFNQSLIASVVATHCFLWGFSANADQGSPIALSDLQQQLQIQQKEISVLKEKLEATAQMLEQQMSVGDHGSNSHGSNSNIHIGGYGEMHYNNLTNQTSGGTDKKEIDLHRMVLFIGHDFNERIRFWSELEVEHAQAGEGKAGGEVSMEQLYVEFDLNDNMTTRVGTQLVPAGIVNETHEPPTFYGVERNPVENKIIPTTWREGGVSIQGLFAAGLSYDLAIHSGFETNAVDNYTVRKGRNSVRKAPANDLAYTGRIKWTGVAGVEFAVTLQHQSDITQSADVSAGAATLLETHAVINQGPLGLRVLYATWELDGIGPRNLGADQQTGWYAEPSYKVNPKLGLFARYNQWDNQAGNSADTEYTQTDIGFNYWPHADVVLKLDYQNQDVPTGKDEFDGFNLGVGYQF